MSLKGKSLKTDFIKFVIPTIITLWIYHMYIIVDGIFVSRGVSHTGLAAVNISHPFTNLLFSVGVLIAVGTSTITAIYMGRGKIKHASSLFTQSIVVLLIAGGIISVVVMTKLDAVAKLLGAEKETFDLVRDYMRGMAPFSASFMISYYLEVLIKTDGYPARATIIVTVGCILNALLDYIFIFIFKLGVWGAAFATGISQTFVVMLYILHFISHKATFKLCIFKPELKILGRITLIGIPEGITELCAGLTVFMFNRVIIAFLGEGHIIYYTVSAYVNTLVIMTMVAVSQGIQPLVSFYLGRGDLATCKKLLKYSFVVSSAIAVTAFATVNIFAKPIVNAFIDNATQAVISASILVLRRFSVSFLFMGINIVIAGYLTAMSRPKGAFVISTGRGFLLPVAALFALAYTTGGSGIWWAQLIAEIICIAVSLAFLKIEGKQFGKLTLH